MEHLQGPLYSGSDIYMNVLSPDRRCPYPYPRVYCGEEKTTFVARTREPKADTNSSGAHRKLESSVAYPYPGYLC
jgi:hypothetical protein